MSRNVGDEPREARTELGELGIYQLIAEIARGKLSTVYLARRRGALGVQRLLAVKRMHDEYVRERAWAELFLDEARLVSSVHHANVVGVLDVATDDGCYLVMDYVEGASLDTLLARAGSSRPVRYIIPPIVDTLHGLQALHAAQAEDGQAHGIVHQAPRGRHILVGIDGTARLTDFSQMRAHRIRPLRERNERLRVAYMAPEQALDPDGVGPRADLFTLGITLWEALTGERLFAADTDERAFQQLLHRRIPRPSEVGLRPPRCFDAICLRALDRHPSHRFSSAAEMARELRDTALNHALYATSDEVGDWVKALAGDVLRERRRLAGSDPLPSPQFRLESGVSTAGSVLETGPRAAVTSAAVSPGSEKEGAEETSSRARFATPRGGFQAAVVAPPPAGESTPAAPPAPAPIAAEKTSPGWSMPARRDGNTASPGEYRQTLHPRGPRAPASSQQELSAPTGHASTPGGSARDEVSPGTTSGTGPEEGGEPTDVSGVRASSELLRAGRGRTIVEVAPQHIRRSDSTPQRWPLPQGPVGSPHRPVSTRGEADVADAYPSLLQPSPWLHPPSGVALPTGAAAASDDSLRPPSGAAETEPPPSPSVAKRPLGLWLVSGMLSAIIVMAAVIVVRQWTAAPTGPDPAVQSVSASANPEAPSSPGEQRIDEGPTPQSAAAGSPAPGRDAKDAGLDVRDPAPGASDVVPAEPPARARPRRAPREQPAPKDLPLPANPY